MGYVSGSIENGTYITTPSLMTASNTFDIDGGIESDILWEGVR